MQNLNPKFYQLFNYDERLKLALAAIARGDKEEMTLLERSCPTRHYVGVDLAYKNRLQALFIIALEFNRYLLHYQYKLQITEGMVAAFSLLADSEALLATFQPKLGNLNIVETVFKLLDAIPKHQSALKSLCTAFVEFCNDVDVDYKNVLALDKCFGETVNDLSPYLCSDALKEDELVQQMKKDFLAIWRAYVFE